MLFYAVINMYDNEAMLITYAAGGKYLFYRIGYRR